MPVPNKPYEVSGDVKPNILSQPVPNKPYEVSGDVKPSIPSQMGCDVGQFAV